VASFILGHDLASRVSHRSQPSHYGTELALSISRE
jgi:hypothetical protein